jgi:Helix-turn-helix domain of transposase family ISL3/Transposase
VPCPEHGVITAAVPWARHGAAHTRFFDDQVAWLAAARSKTTLTSLMRISWRTAGVIIARVDAEAEAACDRFAGPRRIGIGEAACKRGHKYLVIVVNHDTGMLIWAAPGRETKTVHAFFDQLGEERCKLLAHLSAGRSSVLRTRRPPYDNVAAMGWYQFSPRSCCPVGQSRTCASVRPRAEMGFPAAGPIPPRTPAGITRVYERVAVVLFRLNLILAVLMVYRVIRYVARTDPQAARPQPR